MDGNNNSIDDKLENQKFLLELYWPYVQAILSVVAIAVLSYYPPPDSARDFAYGVAGTFLGGGLQSMGTVKKKKEGVGLEDILG